MTAHDHAQGCAAALAGLASMTPARLSALHRRWGWAEAWERIRSGALDEQVLPLPGLAGDGALARLVPQAARVDPAAVLEAHRRADVQIRMEGGPGYPTALAEAPHPPAVLFTAGSDDALELRRVAIVGTRDCTRSGRDIAFELGRGLAAAGVAVVSGLALGVDGAAHAGALEARAAPPVAVVGSGLDVVYPKRNATLWRAVRRAGLLVSEHPLGVVPRPWHFLARNRIIAALAEVVVVVESHERGGALQTALDAEELGRTVMAVPGSVRSAASVGSNALLSYPHTRCCTGVDDVLAELGVSLTEGMATPERRRRPSVADAVVLDAVGWEPTSLDQVVGHTGQTLGEITLAVDRLEEEGWLARRGAWLERLGAQGPPSARLAGRGPGP